MEEPVVAFDLGRMLLGQEPPLFLLEIALRTVIIYAYTFFLIRWLGSRSIGQLSLVEFLLVIALGSAVGDAMFYPNVPLIHAMIVITVVVMLDKALSHVVARNSRMEDAIEGKSVAVIGDGLINWRELEKLNLGHDELFEQLRLKNIRHLGQVRAAYFETNGLLSVFEQADNDRHDGLSIEPRWDVSKPETLKAGQAFPGTGRLACIRCAQVIAKHGTGPVPECPRCAAATWHRLEG